MLRVGLQFNEFRVQAVGAHGSDTSSGRQQRTKSGYLHE